MGASDISRYKNGAKLMYNMIVQPQGGTTRRSGTRVIGSGKDPAHFGRLVPFEFSDTQAYVLEFGQNYIRFYRNRTQIVDPVNPTNPIEVATPYAAIDLMALKFTQSADTLYITHKNYPPYKLARSSDTVWTPT